MRYQLPMYDFARMIACSPGTLELLLRQQGVSSLDLAARSLGSLGLHLDREDCYNLEYIGEVSPDRVAQLKALAGIQPSMLRLLAALYQRYCLRIEMAYNQSGSYALSEEEIRFLLTGGSLPLQFVFLVRDSSGYQVCKWGFEFGSLIGYVFEDDRIGEQCVRYLLSRGACFPSEDAVLAHAVRESWPNTEEALRAHGSSKR